MRTAKNMTADAGLSLWVGRTTVPTREVAELLAADLVKSGLAACVQTDGPIRSHYLWKGEYCVAEEFGVTVKFLPANASAVQTRIRANHPYDVPQWIAVPAVAVLPEYLAWAGGRG